jgi:predicted nucleic acid-binding protein
VRRLIVLDTSPLGLLASPAKTDLVAEVDAWARLIMASGHLLHVPAIADYEIRRELVRANLMRSLGRLDQFNAEVRGRFLSLTDEDLRLAAQLWAQARNPGTPTGDPKELDGDVLIAAQALRLGAAGSVVVATANATHLAQFVEARHWNDIKP